MHIFYNVGKYWVNKYCIWGCGLKSILLPGVHDQKILKNIKLESVYSKHYKVFNLPKPGYSKNEVVMCCSCLAFLFFTQVPCSPSFPNKMLRHNGFTSLKILRVTVGQKN